jgi:hypothetical protein
MTMYGKADALAISGVTYRQLDYWTRAGYLTAVFVPGAPVDGGSGFERRWSDVEVVRAAVMRVLADHGIAAESASKATRRGIWWPESGVFVVQLGVLEVTGECLLDFSPAHPIPPQPTD